MKTINDLKIELQKDYGDKIAKSIADEDYDFINDICDRAAREGISLAAENSCDDDEYYNDLVEFIRISLIELITQ
jgi:capsule polysaccharide export protein KpsE/RkpR